MSGAYGFDGGGYGSYSGDGGYGANRGGGRGGGGGGGYGGGGGGYEGDRGGRVGRGSSGGGSRGGGRSSGSEREGDWRCPNPGCGNLNFARRVDCNKCGTPSPGGGGGGGGGGMRGGLGGGFESSRGRGGSYYDGGSGRAGSDYDGRNTRSGSYGSSQGRDDGGSSSYAPDAVPPPSSYDGGPASFLQSYGAPRYGGDSRNDSRGGMRSGASGGYEGENRNPSGGYGGCQSDAPVAVKQCDENCGDSCDNSRIYLSNLPPNVTVDELRELFGSIGQVARIKQKRGYKDQWPWSIKIYTDEQGKNKGDAVLSYEDPSAAHSAGGFFNNHELRGHKISVAMAEKSAPKAPSSYGSGGGGGRGGYGGDRRRDNFRDGGSGPNRNYHGGNRSNPY